MPPLVGLCVLVEPLESVLLFLCLKTSGGPFGELSVGILFYWEFFFFICDSMFYDVWAAPCKSFRDP